MFLSAKRGIVSAILSTILVFYALGFVSRNILILENRSSARVVFDYILNFVIFFVVIYLVLTLFTFIISLFIKKNN